MSRESAVQPWLQCQELLVRIREAMVGAAIRALHREIDAGRIRLNAEWVKTEAPDEELKKELLLLNRMTAEAPEMMRRYSDYIDGAGRGLVRTDADAIMRIESVRKLSLAVSYISLLMVHVRVIEDWLSEIEEKPNGPDASTLLGRSMNKERIDALAFAIDDNGVNDALLTSEESTMLRWLIKQD